MIIINIKDGETIDRALRRYKKKYIDSGILKELRNRKAFTKPSITRREEVLKAVYRDQVRAELEQA
jgi:small subunit ribosomal protein S21